MEKHKKRVIAYISFVIAICITALAFPLSSFAQGNGQIQINGLSRVDQGKVYFNAQGTTEEAGYIQAGSSIGDISEGPIESGGQQVLRYNNATIGTIPFSIAVYDGYKINSLNINGTNIQESQMNTVDVQDNMIIRKFDATVTSDGITTIQVQYSKTPSVNPEQPGTNSNIAIRVEGDAVTNGVTESNISILYSTDLGVNWKTIDQQTTKDNNTYIFPSSINSLQLKVVWTDGDYMIQTNIVPESTLNNNQVATLSQTGNYSLQIDHEVFTLSWSYNDPNAPEDALVKNGTVSVEPGDGINGSSNTDGGYYVITPGTNVKIFFKPNYGYQFNSGSLNGMQLVAGEEVSSFTFIMPNTQLHLSALFEQSDDIIHTTSTSISGGTIENGQNAIASGNLELNISDADVSNDLQQKLNSVAENNGELILSYLDLELNHIINKGSSSDKWITNLTELPDNISISLKLDNRINYDDVEIDVIREHNGKLDTIPAIYHKNTGELTFEAGKFSTYAIAVRETEPDTVNKTDNSVSDNEKIDTPLTGDNTNLNASFVALIASAMVLLLPIKKKKLSK